MLEILLSHHGLAATTVAHALLTLATGIMLQAERYGYPPRGRWRPVVRVAHTSFGLLMIAYLCATYVVGPF
ncbi:hypothetical protein VB773_21190 [Haloarculaceae archaeon H-GB2-1]|nr:hypothetical protein [Haloarculaceae archaeon H-GB1-1]MEA5389367.1 hypothetical protein [Haloarculaceae archaeon H-GB11]MEA5409835.1 hypothetical protein [Haloarculaceae archaeon H-GB2-1]